jgi:predicted TIM-barrel fold metal-dependent hydrolase
MTTERRVALADLPVVDGHCHPLLPDPLALGAGDFLSFFTEAREDTMAVHVQHTGLLQRAIRGLGGRLGVHADIDRILERRRQVGVESGCRTLTESRVAALLVDTGYPPEAMAIDSMRKILPCRVHEVFRIETCAQSLLVENLPYEEFLAVFREQLRAAAAHVVAFKSIIAYRSGLAIRPWTADHISQAYRTVTTRVQAGGTTRLTEQPLLDTLVTATLEVCRDTGRPLQFHSGFGDPDVDLLQANPILLRSVLEDQRWASVPIVALHMSYPYFREAAYLASVWPRFYVDLSLALPFLGAGAMLPLVEMISLAPSSKLLYGSDLRGLPELFALSADWGRATLADALSWLVDRGDMDADEARQVGRRILAENAIDLYRL